MLFTFLDSSVVLTVGTVSPRTMFDISCSIDKACIIIPGQVVSRRHGILMVVWMGRRRVRVRETAGPYLCSCSQRPAPPSQTDSAGSKRPTRASGQGLIPPPPLTSSTAINAPSQNRNILSFSYTHVTSPPSRA